MYSIGAHWEMARFAAGRTERPNGYQAVELTIFFLASHVAQRVAAKCPAILMAFEISSAGWRAKLVVQYVRHACRPLFSNYAPPPSAAFFCDLRFIRCPSTTSTLCERANS